MGAKRKRLELPEIAIMSVRDFPSAVDFDWVVKISRTAPSDLSGWRRLLLFGLRSAFQWCQVFAWVDLIYRQRLSLSMVGLILNTL